MGVTFKNRIRTEMRERRRRLTLEERSVASNALAKNLLQLMGFKRVGRIGAYMANDGEIDPLPALLDCLQRGYKCFLPVLLPGQRPSVRFANFSNTSKFRLNQYGILEPDLYQQHCLNAIQLEWILLPLVAFDMAGNRLGMGGGYYDSSLALIPHRKNWQRPRLIGLAYEFQRVDQIVVDEWDVQMHSILTDKKLYTVESSHTR